MKKANEILNEYLDKFDRPNNTPYSLAEEAMIEYAKQACKEQRIICSKSFKGWDDRGFNISNKIMNSPEPNLQ